MKKIVTFFILLVVGVSVTYSQAPQGLNYQAIAYSTSGTAIANQPISVRLSILDSSATGTIVYQETQNPSTDNTGLFSIVIGNGTVVSGVFANINWASGSKWLKTEIDITGGTNYVVMGTTQFMSVPYALYANKSSYSSGSFTIPDGFDNATPVLLQDSVSYTVPSGKNLYIPNAQWGISIDGDTLTSDFSSAGTDSKTLVGASEGSIVWSRESKLCFLVNKVVQWKTMDISQSPFTVPNGKQFVILNYTVLLHNRNTVSANWKVTLNNIPLEGSVLGCPALTNSLLDEGDILSTVGYSTVFANIAINGYFKDKN